MALDAYPKPPLGSWFGNPNKPKFYAGPKGWSPINQDVCWKAVCKAENDHLDKMLNNGSAETDVAGMSLNLSATNPELLSKLSKTASLSKVMREQARLKGELTAMKSLLSKAYENEARARVLAEKEAAAQAMEKHALERELHGYKKVVDKMMKVKRGKAGLSVATGRSHRSGASGARFVHSPLRASGSAVVSPSGRPKSHHSSRSRRHAGRHK